MQIGGTYVKRERMRIGWMYANREKGLISIQAFADFSLIYHLFHELLTTNTNEGGGGSQRQRWHLHAGR